MEYDNRNRKLDPFSFGPSEISPDREIHGVAPSKVRSDLENDTDNQCKSASCITRLRSATPPAGRVYCYICGYPCFQNGGTIYDTFSVQCEHVIPVAALSLLSGLADGTSSESNRFSEIVKKVKQNIGVNKQITDEYDMWAGRIIGSPEYYRIIGEYKSDPSVGIEPKPEDSMEQSPKPSVGIEPKPEDNMAIDETSLSRSNLSMKAATGEINITGEQFGGAGSAGGIERIEEGGGIRGSAYQWAHPVCNMIKSNYPFIIICYTNYGLFFVSDDLKVLLPPGIKEPLGEERVAILSKVPDNTGFECCESLDEYYNKAISTHNLIWLLRTILGLTGEYGSYSEQWKKGILLENAMKSEKPGKPPKGINWENGGYKQLLTKDNKSGFSIDDDIFNEAFGIKEGEDLKLKLLIDGNPQPSADSNYIPLDEWIGRRIQQIKNNILIPILQNICSGGHTSPYPVYQISNLEIEDIPKVSLFSMISTTATGSKICHNMAKIRKTFFDVSKDKRKNKVNIIWSSILFEDLLEVSAQVIRSKAETLKLEFDKNVSNAIRKLAKTDNGLSKILKEYIKSTGGRIVDKVKKAKKIVKKSSKRKKRGGSGDSGLLIDVEGVDTITQLPKGTEPSTPGYTGFTYYDPKEGVEGDTKGVTPKIKVDTSMDLKKTDIHIKIIEHVFADIVLINLMGEKLLHYLESGEYPLFYEFLSDFIGLSEEEIVDMDGGALSEEMGVEEEAPEQPQREIPADLAELPDDDDELKELIYDDSVVLNALKEYGDQDPCLFSSLPTSLINIEGLDNSYFLEVAKLHGYDEMIKYSDYLEEGLEPEPGSEFSLEPNISLEYNNWWIYTEFIKETPESELGEEIPEPELGGETPYPELGEETHELKHKKKFREGRIDENSLEKLMEMQQARKNKKKKEKTKKKKRKNTKKKKRKNTKKKKRKNTKKKKKSKQKKKRKTTRKKKKGDLIDKIIDRLGY
jgi:hypothetical protein